MREQINFVKLLMMLGSLVNSNLAIKKENEVLKGQCKLKPIMPRIFGGNEATPRKYTLQIFWLQLIQLLAVHSVAACIDRKIGHFRFRAFFEKSR